MPLSNLQYDEIMRDYQARQLKNRRIYEVRLKQAYTLAPQLKETDHAISSAAMSKARLLLAGDDKAISALHEELALLRQKRLSIIQSLDFPADYLEPVYDCKDCKDTGYVGGDKCHCFKQAIINTLYSQSNIQEVLERENFKTFSYAYYSDQDLDPVTGLSSLATIKNAVAESRHFIEDFDNKPKNLLLYGDTGVGKTFLSNCLAKELMDRGYSVLYFSAFRMFDILSKGVFSHDEEAIAANQNIFDCDLLIIDDLGTEMNNSFTASQLFLCINERILRGKSTIISTNLGMKELLENYSERTFSRITSSYTLIKLHGNDIRIQKRLHPNL